MLSESQLSALLNAAARAQSSGSEPGTSLIPLLCQAVIQQLKVTSIQLWQIDQNQVLCLWNSASDGNTFSLDDESLRHIEIGELQYFESPPVPPETISQRFSLTSVSLIESIRLTVAFQHSQSHNFDDDLFQITEILSDIRRRELLQKLFQANQTQNRIFNFLGEIQNLENEDELLQVFVTDGVTASEFSRISIASRQGQNGWSVVACTGVDAISERSEEVQRIRSDVIEAEKHAAEYKHVFPLSPGGGWSTATHALVYEKQGELSPADLQSCQLLANQLAMCLAHVTEQNAVNHRRRLQRGSMKKSLIVGFLICTLFGFLLFWQAEFKIKAFGQAVPQQRTEVFAPERGIVQEVKVVHGERVEKGDVLFVIHNDELFVLRETTHEEFVASKARLAALQAISQRNGGGFQTSGGALPPSVEIAELTEKIASLNKQLSLIDDQLSKLKVIAPFDGQVFRERMQEELLGHPIQQGQYILQIAAIDGPWELRLRIPENEIRHVISALSKSEEALPVSFALETSPEIEHLSSINQLAETTDLDSYGKLSTLGISGVRKEEIPDVRLGAGVLAKIHCGTRSLGYLATRRLQEFWSKYSPF